MPDPLAWFSWTDGSPNYMDDPLGEVYCVSFYRGLDPAEVLRRLGPGGPPGREMTFSELYSAVSGAGGGRGGEFVGCVQADGWTVAVEPLGWSAKVAEPRLSRGCEVVAVARHEYAEHSFGYAVDGELITGFSPSFPETRRGADPDRLNGPMSRAGLPTRELNDEAWQAAWDAAWDATHDADAAEDAAEEAKAAAEDAAMDRRYDGAVTRAFRLAAEITGVPFTTRLLDGPLLVGATDRNAR